MQYRRLSGTDLDVSVICLGPMRAAAQEPGNDERSRAGERALRRALDLGVNFLHSSYEYGTRWMMGRALQDHPSGMTSITLSKCPCQTSRMAIGSTSQNSACASRRRCANCTRSASPCCSGCGDQSPTATRAASRCSAHRGRRGGGVREAAGSRESRAPVHLPVHSGVRGSRGCDRQVCGAPRLLQLDRNGNGAPLCGPGAATHGIHCDSPLYEGLLTDERATPMAGDRFADPQYAPAPGQAPPNCGDLPPEIGGSMTAFALRSALPHPLWQVWLSA